MRHFVNDDGFNMFRLGWQYLLNNALGPVNQANLNEYDALVQACLGTGAYCIIDIHNYARWNGAVSSSLLSRKIYVLNCHCPFHRDVHRLSAKADLPTPNSPLLGALSLPSTRIRPRLFSECEQFSVLTMFTMHLSLNPNTE